MNKFSARIFIIVLVIFLSSCARIPVKAPDYFPIEKISTGYPTILRKDIIHAVAPGETVWRIAKMYDVDIKDITRANRLKSSKEIEMGQRLTVPNAAPFRSVITLYPSKKWKYIIIHHSATDEGNALSFHGYHRRRGFDDGLGYHFVIGNGTKGKQDGQIEVSPRWIKQQDGAHCKASNRNFNGIGICLVGNFNEERVSREQMESLIYLVNRLKKYYKISLRNIMGHKEVPGAKTECPGKHFPWKKFKNRLRVAD